MKAALLIIDVQNDYFRNGVLQIKKAKEIIPNINKLRNDYSTKFTNVFISEINNNPEHISFKESPLSKQEDLNLDKITNAYKGKFPYFCISGTEGSNLHSDLQLKGNEIIIKKNEDKLKEEMSCFQNPILNETLVNNKINMVFLCGFTLDFNVGFTAINCSKLGFETYVIKDACKSFSDESAKSMEKIFEKNNVKCIIMEQFEEIIKRVGEVKVEEEKNEEKKE